MNAPHETEDLGISLDTPFLCRQELQRVANGTASLAVDKTRALEALDEALTALEDLEEKWELVEAAAFNAVEAEKGTTATQIKARAVEAISRNEKTAQLRLDLRAQRAEIEQREREVKRISARLDALEARGSYAQSAIKAHDQEARYNSFATGGD